MNYSSRFGIYYATNSDLLSQDNDCACPVVHPVHQPQSIPADALIQTHPHYQYIPLSDDHVVCFIPSLSQIAVLDSAAQQFVNQLTVPHRMDSLSDEEQDAARDLFRLGLLQAADAKEPKPPESDELVAWLHVTNACNLRCTYCYLEKTNDSMSADTGLAAIDSVMRVAQQHRYANVQLKYAGGEASLNLSLVEEMHAYAQQLAAQRTLTLRGVVLSNGVGLTRQKLQRIRDAQLRLMISLDGPAEFHDAQRPTLGHQGSYHAAVRSAEHAKKLGLNVTICVTVTGKSVAGLPDLVTWLLERDLQFSLNFYRENDCSVGMQELQLDAQHLIVGMRAAYQQIEQRLPHYSLLGCLLDRSNLTTAHSHACGAGKNYLVIDHHGGIASCQMDITHTITSIWDADPLNVIRLDQTGVRAIPVEEKQSCRSCEWRYWCAGGCPIATFRATGRYDVKSPNCEIYKALYPDVVRLEGLRILHWAIRT